MKVLGTHRSSRLPKRVADREAKPTGRTPKKRELPIGISDASRQVIVRHMQQMSANSAISAAMSTYTQVPDYEILALRTGPEILIENRAAWVEFYVYNNTKVDLLNVFVRTIIQPLQSINTYPGYFEVPVDRLISNDVLFNAISFQLPAANPNNIVTLELYRIDRSPGREFPVETDTVIASATFEFDVGARFSFHMEEIQIRKIASHHSDTVYAGFAGASATQVWSNSNMLGNHGSGTTIAANIADVGPFNAFKGDGQTFTVGALIANHGHTSQEDDEKKGLLAASEIIGTVVTTVFTALFPAGAALWAALTAGADAVNAGIINYAFADCDTVVMSETVSVTTEDIFHYTYDPSNQATGYSPPLAWMLEAAKDAGERIDLPSGAEWLGTGCEDSVYSTSFSPVRHRHSPYGIDHSADGKILSPGQIVRVGAVISNSNSPFIASPAIDFAVEGPGIIDSTSGNYKAEASPFRKFAVVRWTYFVETNNSDPPDESDFSLILLA